jgi:hypothetical protein
LHLILTFVGAEALCHMLDHTASSSSLRVLTACLVLLISSMHLREQMMSRLNPIERTFFTVLPGITSIAC